MPSDAHWCDSLELLFQICPSLKVQVASRLQGLSEGVNEPCIKAREGTSAPLANGPAIKFQHPIIDSEDLLLDEVCLRIGCLIKQT